MSKLETYRQARDIINSEQKSVADFARLVGTKCTWHDVDDVVFWKKGERRKKRRKILDELVPDRKCPCCGQTRITPGGWLVRKDGAVVVCRACYFSLKPKHDASVGELFMKIVRWQVDGPMLRQARIDAGVTQNDLATMIGMSPARLCQLEKGGKTIDDSQKTALKEALILCNVRFIADNK